MNPKNSFASYILKVLFIITLSFVEPKNVLLARVYRNSLSSVLGSSFMAVITDGQVSPDGARTKEKVTIENDCNNQFFL